MRIGTGSLGHGVLPRHSRADGHGRAAPARVFARHVSGLGRAVPGLVGMLRPARAGCRLASLQPIPSELGVVTRPTGPRLGANPRAGGVMMRRDLFPPIEPYATGMLPV